VEDQPAGKLMIRVAVVGVIFIFLGMLLPSLQDIVPLFIVGLVLSIIVMAIITKGDLSSYKIVNDIHVFVDGMRIKQLVFPFDEVSKLSFEFQSYHEAETYHNRGKRGQKSYGLGNGLSFRYRQQNFTYQFYLQSPQHYKAFVNMLEILYENNIPFSENNLHGPTYLMQNVNNDQLALIRRQYPV
jgi:hypothetical protein